MAQGLRVGMADKASRGDAGKQQLEASPSKPEVFVFSDIDQPSLASPGHFRKCKTDSPEQMVELARAAELDLMVIGPEEPLKAGVVDALLEAGVPCVGPT